MPVQSDSLTAYDAVKLAHVLVIAAAGSAGNIRLWRLLVALGGSRAAAWRVLFAWLAANLFLGSQLAWILRPFIGNPDMPVQFLRAAALHSNFYENVFGAIAQILSQ